jgi:hypothetical protein
LFRGGKMYHARPYAVANRYAAWLTSTASVELDARGAGGPDDEPPLQALPTSATAIKTATMPAGRPGDLSGLSRTSKIVGT